MNTTICSFVLTCLVSGVAFASEEAILLPTKVSLSADGRKDFGEVSATLEMATKEGEYRIKAITLTVDGKKHVVPEGQFADLRDPLPNTAEFRSEAGFGDKPLLYLTFRLAKRGAASVAEYPRVYIRYQAGKLLERSIYEPKRGP